MGGGPLGRRPQAVGHSSPPPVPVAGVAVMGGGLAARTGLAALWAGAPALGGAEDRAGGAAGATAGGAASWMGVVTYTTPRLADTVDRVARGPIALRQPSAPRPCFPFAQTW
jgi:hypothetical protein